MLGAEQWCDREVSGVIICMPSHSIQTMCKKIVTETKRGRAQGLPPPDKSSSWNDLKFVWDYACSDCS